MAYLSEGQIFAKLSDSGLTYTVSKTKEDYGDGMRVTLNINFPVLGAKSYRYPNLQSCWNSLQLDLLEIQKEIQKFLQEK